MKGRGEVYSCLSKFPGILMQGGLDLQRRQASVSVSSTVCPLVLREFNTGRTESTSQLPNSSSRINLSGSILAHWRGWSLHALQRDALQESRRWQLKLRRFGFVPVFSSEEDTRFLEIRGTELKPQSLQVEFERFGTRLVACRSRVSVNKVKSSRLSYFSSDTASFGMASSPGHVSQEVAKAPVSEDSAEVEMQEEEILEGVSLRHGFLDNKGIKLHYVECGDPNGKLVMLVHGFPNFWYVWKHQFKVLSESGYHVVAPDLRGYNLSSKPEGLPSYGRSPIVSDMLAFIDHFSNGNAAILVGHDWGAPVVWCVAEDHPSKVERLVSVNMGRLSDLKRTLRSHPSQILRSWYMGAMQIPYVFEFFLSFNNYRMLKASLKKSNPNMSEDDIERHVKAYSIPGALKGGMSYYRASVRGLWDVSNKKSVVNAPVTMIWGDKDTYLLPAIAEVDKETVPNARIVHLPECGHWPMWDNTELFNELLLSSIGEKS
ncbi:hypothetical protein R1sor_012489 [Riccia sorocarpa]|uniref:AB hydrolase-1 domain-containing protein n=1 Tax=Riccia sorocarpa TaxID=122646 RepID=A0ABD3I3X3_9MARC